MYRTRVEDRQGDRWSINTNTVPQAVDIAERQHVSIVWVKRKD